jgi:hypothetical protein
MCLTGITSWSCTWEYINRSTEYFVANNTQKWSNQVLEHSTMEFAGLKHSIGIQGLEKDGVYFGFSSKAKIHKIHWSMGNLRRYNSREAAGIELLYLQLLCYALTTLHTTLLYLHSTFRPSWTTNHFNSTKKKLHLHVWMN